MTKTKINTKVVFTVCFLFLVGCIASYLYKGGNVIGHDIEFHSARILGIADAIRGGQFPIKYYNSFGYGGAYLGSIFYGDIFLFLPALFIIIGVPINIVYPIFSILLYFSIWILMYFVAKKWIKDTNISIVSATIFSVSQYMFGNIFLRSAIGECIAIVFYLIMFLGIYNMLHENYSKPWLLTIAFLGFLFSHFTSLIIACIILISVVLFNAKKLCTNKQFWIKSLFALGLFILIGFYSLASFVELYFADKYYISKPWVVPSERTHSIGDFLGISSKQGLGFLLLPAYLFRLFIKKDTQNQKTVKTINIFLIVSTIAIFIISDLFPWKLFDKIFGFIQFPWRLCVFPSVFLSLALGLEFKLLSGVKLNLAKSVMLPLLFITLITNNFYITCIFYDATYTNNVNWNVEWFPTCVELDDYIDRNIYDNNGVIVDYDRKQYTTTTTFESTTDCEYYIVPIVYYKGYSATLVNNDKTINLNIQQTDNGMIKICTNRLQGAVKLEYVGTTIQDVTFGISYGSFIVICLLFIGNNLVKLNKKRPIF